jgi:putative transposase
MFINIAHAKVLKYRYLPLSGMQLGFKTKLKINPIQQQLFAQHAGYSRWVYNWALATIEDFYKSGVKLSYRS